MHDQDHHLSAAQWSLMESLWESGSLTGREATEAMQQKTGWTRSTTLTLLRRMEEKGLIGSAVKNDVKTYFPLLHREEAALQETESLLERVYDGSISLLVSAMTHKRALPREEIDQLYALLEEMEENKP